MGGGWGGGVIFVLKAGPPCRAGNDTQKDYQSVHRHYFDSDQHTKLHKYTVSIYVTLLIVTVKVTKCKLRPHFCKTLKAFMIDKVQKTPSVLNLNLGKLNFI